MERSLVLVKPDGVHRGLIGEVLGRFERRGLKIVALKVIRPPRELVEEHYEEHKGKGFYPGLVDYLTDRPVIAAVIEGPDATEDDGSDGGIKMIRQTVGATRPAEAAPGSIRADLALTVDRNIVHASADTTDAEREVNLWFKPEEIATYERVTESWILG